MDNFYRELEKVFGELTISEVEKIASRDVYSAWLWLAICGVSVIYAVTPLIVVGGVMSLISLVAYCITQAELKRRGLF